MNSLRSSQSKSYCEENSKYNDDSYESDNKQNPIDNLCLNLKRKRERGNSMLSSSSSFSFKAPLALSSKTQSIISSILSKKNKASVINYKPPTLSLPIIKSVNKEKTSMPKASTFKISQKTLEVINKLKMERKNRFEREKKENEMKRRESSFSLRFKYEDLIKEHRELPLPLKYKALLNTFIELDNVIDASKTLRNIVPTFEYLVSTIEQTYHHRFNLTMFQQILHLVPSFFIYQYKKKENDYELMIDIPKDFDERAKLDKNEFSKIQNKYDPIISAMTTQMKEKRITIFKSSLYEIVKEFHTKFLKDNHYKEFDPFIEKTWHHSFELNSVDDIPLYKIEEKPTVTNKFQECIKENDFKNQLLDKVKEDENFINLYDDNNNNNDNHSLSKFVSQNFLNKLKKKEEAIIISKQIVEESKKQHSKKSKEEIIKEIIEQINNVFICARKDSIEWSEFVGNLINSSNVIKQNLSKEETINIVKKICKLFPHWIRIKQHSMIGMIVVREDKIDIFQEVMHNIKLINKD